MPSATMWDTLRQTGTFNYLNFLKFRDPPEKICAILRINDCEQIIRLVGVESSQKPAYEVKIRWWYLF